MIYISEEIPTDLQYFDAYQKLPIWRREKCGRFSGMRDKKLCVAAFFLLSYSLEKEYGIREFEFGYGEFGKPYLLGHDGIFFNISHCGAGVACAVSSAEIGVDIEEYRRFSPFNLRLAQTICNENELTILQESGQAEIEFCKLFTKKESAAKLIGKGLGCGLKNILSEKIVHKLYSSEKYSVSAAAYFAEENQRFYKVVEKILN
ncbi:hypothetical protein AGMMS49975_07210 [Clostridia bacterium]|nr:hypothetical protein AGMMS49975_07210 [Clostridia bacterium]